MDDSQYLSVNKSFTRSEPNLNVLHYRQVLITELQRPDGNGQLFRQCSYQELTSPYSIGHQPTYNLYTPDISKDQVSNFPMLGDCKYGYTCENKLDYSPMDVDVLDDDSNDEYDYYDEEEITDNTNLDRRKLLIQQSGDAKVPEQDYLHPTLQANACVVQKNHGSNVTLILTVCCLGIAIGVSAFYYNNFKGLKDVAVSDIEMDLRSSVSNQNHVIDAIVQNLNSVNSVDRFKNVLTFVGGTGVGKTFVLNQMRRWYSSNAYVSLTYPVHKSLIEQASNISFPNDCFLLSIDDLRLVNVETVGTFIDSITHNCVLIIPVFNVQDMTESNLIRNNKELIMYFKEKYPKSETVLFNYLNQNDLASYLKEKLRERGLNINDHHVFVKSLLTHHDVKNVGFKGVLPKVNLLT